MPIPDDRGHTNDHERVMIARGAPLPDTSGWIGTLALAGSGLGDADFAEVADAIAEALLTRTGCRPHSTGGPRTPPAVPTDGRSHPHPVAPIEDLVAFRGSRA